MRTQGLSCMRLVRVTARTAPWCIIILSLETQYYPSYYSVRLLASGIKNTLHIFCGITVGLGVHDRQGRYASYCHFDLETRAGNCMNSFVCPLH